MMSRVEAYKMALMAVFEVTVVPIVIPFVQIAHVTDGVGMEALEYIIVSKASLIIFHREKVSVGTFSGPCKV